MPRFLLSLPVILLSLTVHEVSHGFAAYKLGDPTARNFGRLTLNPLKHLDPLGTLMMVLFHFGWAKPVPINTRHFKKPRRDMAITAAAGPLSNICLAFIGILLYSIYYKILFSSPKILSIENVILQNIILYFGEMLYMLFSLNLSLAVFNMLPIPPLDGSRILYIFLPPKLYFGVMQYERYIQLGLMLVLWMGLFDGILTKLVNLVASGMIWLVGLIPFLS